VFLESDKIIILSLESENIVSLQVHTGYLTFSLKKLLDCKVEIPPLNHKIPPWRGIPRWLGTTGLSILTYIHHNFCWCLQV